MCFGRAIVTLLSLPWFSSAMIRYSSQTGMKLFSDNNSVFILYKTPPIQQSKQLWNILEDIQRRISHHANLSTCKSGEAVCITSECSKIEALFLNTSHSETNDNSTCTWIKYNAETQENVEDNNKPTTLKVWMFGLVSVGIISLSGLFGGLFWPLINSKAYKQMMSVLIGLAVGSLTATSTFQLIPEGFELKSFKEDYLNTAVFMWGSLWSLYMFEIVSKIVFHKTEKTISEQKNSLQIHRMSLLAENGNHEVTQNEVPEKDGLLSKPDHATKTANSNSLSNTKNSRHYSSLNALNKTTTMTHDDHHTRGSTNTTVAYMIIFGDALHNFVDGMSIGAGYSKDLSAGLGISIAIACEEFPHELGDFAILINSGMPLKKALLYNFLSACTSFGGLALGILMGELEVSVFIFAFAGGLFLYVSLADLMPELNRMVDESLNRSKTSAILTLVLQNIGIFIGVTTLYLITKYPITIS